LDETWANATLMLRKCGQNEETVRITDNMNSSSRHIVHIGRSDGFVEGCVLVYKMDKAMGDY
jgi:hypothetical protein